jgi:hypothetical protein
MIPRLFVVLTLIAACFIATISASPAPGCCPAGKYRPGTKIGVYPVVNADQTVIIIWDAAAKTQHFIRRASFKAEGDDFGFIVPSPEQPTLDESGNEAFPYLFSVTEPETIKKTAPGGGGLSCGCASSKSVQPKSQEHVKVLEEKIVAGFKAAVLESSSAAALVKWLKDNDYAYSPQIEAWAKPYVESKWKFTALKVHKDKDAKGGKDSDDVAAPALRLTFKTDRPLFPYREPDYKNEPKSLTASHRLLRIYFLADARYQGEFDKAGGRWTGKAVWASRLTGEQRKMVLEMLKLPEQTGPAEWFLTEFEDNWPYRVAPSDVYFVGDADQSTLKRPPIIQYVSAPYPTDLTGYALAAAIFLPPLWRRIRRKSKMRNLEGN